jgi:hypothetical protein
VAATLVGMRLRVLLSVALVAYLACAVAFTGLLLTQLRSGR